MLRGEDFVILSHGEVDALLRLMDLVPLGAIHKAVKDGDMGVAQGINLKSDLKRVVQPL